MIFLSVWLVSARSTSLAELIHTHKFLTLHVILDKSNYS